MSSLRKEGYLHLQLDDGSIKPKNPDFLNYWNHLVTDPYIEGDHKFRQRRYSNIIFHRNSEIEYLRSTYFQGERFNRLFGGQSRIFEKIDDNLLTDPIFIDLINYDFCFLLKHGLITSKEYNMGIHQIRTLTTAQNTGRVTPEGIHKDGHPFFAIHFINKSQITGGTTKIYDNNLKLIEEINLSNFGETIFVLDTLVYHGVTDIKPLPGSDKGFRDVLIIEFY
ncbi:2OG-Fe dioxygenase family protein [Moorena sp. SIO2C4]|uniref:2OG-Fe dioxygenase family protein n=1 Tax=Moorena sp. SIO2C4 TaxID=2607824 RepID=UPI0013CD56F7|nr:2OG-Fe dioxygenase family protein [Moorena sp. SIO2C4]NES46298.1 2OG-Fe dioxygenase family protein [Moorena sp. SIO2C4]